MWKGGFQPLNVGDPGLGRFDHGAKARAADGQRIFPPRAWCSHEMLTSDFDYDLPRELIATHPAAERDESRLLILDRDSGAIQHKRFSDLVQFIQPGDLLVLNDSRVINARLSGIRRATGAAVEALLLQPALDNKSEIKTGHSSWTAFCRPARKFHSGEYVDFADGKLVARVVAEGPDGERTMEFPFEDILPLLELYGEIPLPPYIVQRRREVSESAGGAHQDLERYQTVYARSHGSIAAPTAGLHFTPRLLKKITSAGAKIAWVTLHVGAGTFKPVEVDNPAAHPMHTEFFEVPGETARAIIETRAAGGRVIAVGTTTVRTLESAWDATTNSFAAGRQATNILILPGYQFQIVDAMITNFHLPRSTLLMMISAFAGHGPVMAAYHEAIAQEYHFYSYGDAMLIAGGLPCGQQRLVNF